MQHHINVSFWSTFTREWLPLGRSGPPAASSTTPASFDDMSHDDVLPLSLELDVCQMKTPRRTAGSTQFHFRLRSRGPSFPAMHTARSGREEVTSRCTQMPRFPSAAQIA